MGAKSYIAVNSGLSGVTLCRKTVVLAVKGDSLFTAVLPIKPVTSGSVVSTSAAGKQSASGATSTQKTSAVSVVAKSAQLGISAAAKIAAVAVVASSGFASANTSGPVSVVVTTTVTARASASCAIATSKIGASAVIGNQSARGQDSSGKISSATSTGRASASGAASTAKISDATVTGRQSSKNHSAAAPVVILTPDQVVMLTDIWQRFGLDASNPLTENEASSNFGAVTITKTGTSSIVSQRSGAGATGSVDAMLLDLWQRFGLDPVNPMTATDTSISAGTMTQTITSSGTDTTVTRA